MALSHGLFLSPRRDGDGKHYCCHRKQCYREVSKNSSIRRIGLHALPCFCTASTGLRISGKNNYCGDLTNTGKSVYLQMARGLLSQQGHHSRVEEASSQRNIKRRPRSRSYSEVLYEHGLEICRASRGTTQVWVVVPGARRRVFYFVEVSSG